jgi:hypothetical protein
VNVEQGERFEIAYVLQGASVERIEAEAGDEYSYFVLCVGVVTGKKTLMACSSMRESWPA